MPQGFRGRAAVAAALLALAAGCGPQAMLKDPKQQDALVAALASDSTAAAAFYDKLAASDATRRLAAQRLIANPQARQELMFEAARDRTLIEGLINVAVQDTSMRDHIFALVHGMEMMQRR